MAAKFLREAIVNGLTSQMVYLTERQVRSIEGELRDFFAHQIAKEVGPFPAEEEKYKDWAKHEILLVSFFHRVFKNVSAFRSEDEQ